MPHCNTGAKKMMYGGKVKKMESGGVASSIKKSLRPKIRPKNIGSTDSPSTRGQDPKDIYSEEDLKRLLESAGVSKKVEKKRSGGLVGGQVKLDKNKDGKISGEDFRMMSYGGAVKKMKYGGKVGGCRGGGAAIAGTKYTGCK